MTEMTEKIKVMIVDDHAMLREGIKALLASQDDMTVVSEAADGKEALEKAKELSPDIILMDIAMPLMDGLEATRRLQKDAPKSKVLVLTQYDSRDYIPSIVKSGAKGCVPKKAAASELISAIRAIYRGDSFLYPSMAKALMEEYLKQLGPSGGEDSYQRLTDREREMLKLVTEGHSNRRIAEMLGISSKTALGHRTSLMKKLDIHNRTELIKYALRKGLITISA